MSTTRYVTTAWADISECGRYRYALGRHLGMLGGGRLVFVMLNPSTADAEHDDPTLRRCIGFAKAWGYGELVVCNLFALRATDPAGLRTAEDPIGPDNDVAIAHWTQRAQRVVCAWGTLGALQGRDATVLAALRATRPVYALGFTRDGHPRHPLYVKADQVPAESREVEDGRTVNIGLVTSIRISIALGVPVNVLAAAALESANDKPTRLAARGEKGVQGG